MLELSELSKKLKNQVSSDGAYLVLLDVVLPDGEILRLVRNNEPIYWNGNTYQDYPFTVGDIDENSNNELPSLDIGICNSDEDHLVQGIIEEHRGGSGTAITLRVVNSKNLESNIPDFEGIFSVAKTSIDEQWIKFTLGSSIAMTRRVPRRKYLKDSCPFRYKGIECAATSLLTLCNGTLADCKARSNSQRFGGEPGMSLDV